MTSFVGASGFTENTFVEAENSGQEESRNPSSIGGITRAHTYTRKWKQQTPVWKDRLKSDDSRVIKGQFKIQNRLQNYQGTISYHLIHMLSSNINTVTSNPYDHAVGVFWPLTGTPPSLIGKVDSGLVSKQNECRGCRSWRWQQTLNKVICFQGLSMVELGMLQYLW